MAGERTLKVTILGDAKKLQGAFGDAGKAADGMGSKFSGAAKTAGIAVGGLAIAGGAFAKSAIGAASDLDETLSKIDQVFGKAGSAASVYAEELAAAKKEAEKAEGKYVEAVRKADLKIAEIRGKGGKDAEAKAAKVMASLKDEEDAMDAAAATVADVEKKIVASQAAMSKSAETEGKKISAEIKAWAGTAAGSLGQTKQQALDAAATFAIFGKAAGMTGTDLTGFSKQMTTLASDLASFHNTKPEEAVEALGAAMRGESEPLRRYGVNLNDATMRAKAMELGIYNGTGALTSQQKTLAAHALILEQTKDAQGDFERTSAGLANQQRILSATMGDLSASIGTALLPAMKGITSTVAEIVTAFSEGGWSGAMDKVAEIWGELWPKIKAKLGEFLTGLGNFIVEEGPGILRQLGEWTGKFLQWAGDMIPPLLSKLGELLAKMLQWVSDNREAILDKLGEWTSKFLQWAGEVVPPLLKKLGELLGKMLAWVSDHREEIFDKLGEWTAKFIEWAADVAVKLLEKLPVVTDALVKWIGEQGPTIAKELLLWIAEFVLFVEKMQRELLLKLVTEVGPALVKWIAGMVADIAVELLKWTAEFTGWVLGLVPKILAAGADLVGWIGEEAGKLPGQLAHWTAEFVAWMGRLPAEAASAIAGLGQAIGEVVWNWVKDRVSGLNPFGGIGSGGANTGSGGFNIPGRTVPAAGGSAPTNSQGTPGQTFGQMFAAGMTIAEIAEKTGQDPANITAALMREIPGMVLGGDHDDENDGDLSPSGPGEQNLTANAVKLRRQIQASFKGYSSIGGYAYRTTAAGTPSDHATGKALDVMMPRLHDPLGDKIAAWAVGENETKYVIWDNQIWSRQKPYWRDYATSGKVGAANQGSATGRHEDHVHISVLGKGGIVRARQGGTLALLGEAGQDEAVVPLPRGGGTAVGTTVVVHVHGNVIRERDLALSIRDGLLDLQRQGVSLGFN